MPLGKDEGLRNYCETVMSDNVLYDHVGKAVIFRCNLGRTLYYQQMRI